MYIDIDSISPPIVSIKKEPVVQRISSWIVVSANIYLTKS